MRARAASVAATRERIVAAAVEGTRELLTLDVTLEQVAERAGVSVQTVLRHFGSREGLFEAAMASARAEVMGERRAPAGDVRAAVRAVVDHYEARGEFALFLLGQEGADERVRRLTDDGRAAHRRWAQECFGPHLAGMEQQERVVVTDLLVVATDVYTWALLRRDRGLSRAQTESRMRRLVEAVLSGALDLGGAADAVPRDG
jgi:AcrR family transcriptional regulator